MYVEIKRKQSTNHRPYKDKHYGEQEAALFAPGSDYPLPFKLNVEVGCEYEPGRYSLGRDSFSTDQHGNLRLGRARLVAVTPAAATKAA